MEFVSQANRLLVVFCFSTSLLGCGHSKPPESTSTPSIPVVAEQKSPVPEVVDEEISPTVSSAPVVSPDSPCDIVLPDRVLAVPKWAGKRESEPFYVQKYIELQQQRRTPAECAYLNGMAMYWPRVTVFCDEASRDDRVARATALSEWLLELIPDFEPSPATWDEGKAREVLNELKPVLAAFDAAQAYPKCVFSTGFLWFSDTPHVEAAQAFVRPGAIEVKLCNQDNDQAGVERALRRMFRLSRDLRPCGGAIQQIIASVIDRMAFLLFETELLSRADLTAADCDRLVKIITDHESALPDSLMEAIFANYVMEGQALWQLEHGEAKFSDWEMAASPEVERAINYEVEWSTLDLLYRFVLLDYRTAPYHSVLQRDEYTLFITNMKLAAARQFDQPLEPDQKWTKACVIAISPADLPQVRESIARVQVRAGGIKSLLLIRRFQLRHGRLPDSLTDAFQDAEAGPVPDDPYSGEKLNYRVLDDVVKVYSVGTDQEDNHAETDWAEGNQRGDFILAMPILKSQASP